jgi:hypothetical protein
MNLHLCRERLLTLDSGSMRGFKSTFMLLEIEQTEQLWMRLRQSLAQIAKDAMRQDD